MFRAAPLRKPAATAAASATAQVLAGTYKVDPNHTQVVWSVNHMGFSRLYGLVGQLTGPLEIDPAHPVAAVVQIDIPISGLRVTTPAFAEHLQTPDLFEIAKHPTARFVSAPSPSRERRRRSPGTSPCMA